MYSYVFFFSMILYSNFDVHSQRHDINLLIKKHRLQHDGISMS